MNDDDTTTPEHATEKPKMAREWYTTSEAAAALGLSAASIRNAVKRGALAVQQVHGRLNAISAEELDRYRAMHLGGQGWATRRAPDYTPAPSAEAQRRYRARKHERERAADPMPENTGTPTPPAKATGHKTVPGRTHPEEEGHA